MNDTPLSVEPALVYSPTNEELQLIQDISDRVKLSDDVRRQWRSDAEVCLAYWAGKPWDYQEPATMNGIALQPEDIARRQRIRINYLSQTIDTMVAKLLSGRPGWEPTPATEDPGDVEQARACVDLTEMLWQDPDLDIRTTTLESVQLAAVTGLGFLHVWWDVNSDKTDTGFPDIASVDPFTMKVDPNARRFKDARWVCRQSYVPLEVIRERYPERGEYVEADSLPLQASQSQERTYNRLTLGGDESANCRNLVTTWDYYQKPTRKHPNGLHVVATKKLVLHVEEWPGRFPFFAVSVKRTPGSVYGRGWAWDMAPLQETINNAATKRDEIVSQTAVHRVMVQGGAAAGAGGVDDVADQWTNDAVSLVAIPPGASVVEQVPAALPAAHTQLIEESAGHMRNITGLSELAFGEVGSNLSGRAAGMLTELDATVLSQAATEVERAMEQVGRYLLELWRQWAPEQVTARFLGSDGKAKTSAFQKQAISPDNVRIVAASMLPVHPTLKRERILSMWQSGVYDPANPAAAQVRKDLEFGDTDYIDGDDAYGQRAYAREENYEALAGRLGDHKPEPWELHQVHYDEHLGIMSGDEFRSLPADRQQELVAHLAWHAHYLAQPEPWWPAYTGIPGTTAPVGPTDQSVQAQASAQGPSPKGPGVPELDTLTDMASEGPVA